VLTASKKKQKYHTVVTVPKYNIKNITLS